MPTFVTPKHLTTGVCEAAVKIALRAVMEEGSILHTVVKRHCCHIVVLVQGMETEGRTYPDYPIHPVLMYERSVGDKGTWTAKYDEIAQCKALQLWHDRNDDRTNIMPHLLFPGDTVYWGGVKRQGLVVTCSGVQPWFDKMISGMIADLLIGLACNAWMTSEERRENSRFLS